MNAGELTQVETMTSREIAELTGKEHSNVMRDIRNIVNNLGEEKGQFIFEESYYINQQNKEQPMYKLDKKSCLLLASGYSVILRARIINRWEELELKEQKNQLVLPNFNNPAEAARAWAAEYEAKQIAMEKAEKLEKEVIHKEDVIVGLVEDIDLATKRQRITQIIRHNSVNYRERYSVLYKEFELKFHCDISRRMENEEVMESIRPKIKNKMDYIDRVMHMIPQLYEIACKIFEGDVEELKKEWDA